MPACRFTGHGNHDLAGVSFVAKCEAGSYLGAAAITSGGRDDA